MSLIKKLSYKDLIIFIIPIVVWGFYLYIFNPGILSYDSYNQLEQIQNHDFNNWHPFFHTFIEMICLKVYDSPISIGILQIIIFSCMWTLICRYYRKDAYINRIVLIIQLLLTIFISVIPINAIYSITLWYVLCSCYYHVIWFCV